MAELKFPANIAHMPGSDRLNVIVKIGGKTTNLYIYTKDITNWTNVAKQFSEMMDPYKKAKNE